MGSPKGSGVGSGVGAGVGVGLGMGVGVRLGEGVAGANESAGPQLAARVDSKHIINSGIISFRNIATSYFVV